MEREGTVRRRNGPALHHVCSPIDKIPRAKAAGKWVSEEGHASLVHSPMKVGCVLANHSLSSTASQGRSNIPISFFHALGITPPGEDTKEGKDMERTWKYRDISSFPILVFPVDKVTIIFLPLYHASFPFSFHFPLIPFICVLGIRKRGK